MILLESLLPLFYMKFILLPEFPQRQEGLTTYHINRISEQLLQKIQKVEKGKKNWKKYEHELKIISSVIFS